MKRIPKIRFLQQAAAGAIIRRASRRLMIDRAAHTAAYSACSAECQVRIWLPTQSLCQQMKPECSFTLRRTRSAVAAEADKFTTHTGSVDIYLRDWFDQFSSPRYQVAVLHTLRRTRPSEHRSTNIERHLQILVTDIPVCLKHISWTIDYIMASCEE